MALMSRSTSFDFARADWSPEGCRRMVERMHWPLVVVVMRSDAYIYRRVAGDIHRRFCAIRHDEVQTDGLGVAATIEHMNLQKLDLSLLR